jgi:nitrite reductase/ring-hydroxylating ferredoxin subunit
MIWQLTYVIMISISDCITYRGGDTDADLSTGFLNEEEKTVTCPVHLFIFKLYDGVSQNPPAEKPLKTYNVKIENKGVRKIVE